MVACHFSNLVKPVLHRTCNLQQRSFCRLRRASISVHFHNTLAKQWQGNVLQQWQRNASIKASEKAIDSHTAGSDKENGVSGKQTSLKSALYLVATPIGNLEDITLRALRVLKEADVILAEDTRHSQKLLNHFEIRTAMYSLHEHNEAARIDKVQ